MVGFSETDYPPPIVKLSDDPRYKKTIKHLQEKLQQLSPSDLSPDLIASRRSLENLMKWVWLKAKNPSKLPELMKGWRHKFGVELVKVLDNQRVD